MNIYTLRERAIQLILAEVHKGYTIDEAVKRIIKRNSNAN